MQKAKRRINNQFLITGFSIIFREKVPEFPQQSYGMKIRPTPI